MVYETEAISAQTKKDSAAAKSFHSGITWVCVSEEQGHKEIETGHEE